MAQETQTGALYQPRGVGWGERQEGDSKGRGYTYTWDFFGSNDAKAETPVLWPPHAKS